MVQQRRLNLLSRAGAFASMQSYPDGVKPGDGGTELVMANIALMIKPGQYGV
jgi:hypothetical protein